MNQDFFKGYLVGCIVQALVIVFLILVFSK